MSILFINRFINNYFTPYLSEVLDINTLDLKLSILENILIYIVILFITLITSLPILSP